MGDFDAALLVLLQAYAQGAQTAAGHISGIGVYHLAHQIRVFTQLVPTALVSHGGAEHVIGMADNIFGASLNRNVDIKIQRLEQDAGRPGVIDHDHHFRCHGANRLHHRRDILDLHSDRAG
ncbi:hypothetical protein D3C71_1504030 [compost metagenome]